MTAEVLGAAREVLADQGFVVLPQAVPAAAVAAALRLLNLTIRRDGLSADQIAEWQHGTFFPHLRWEPEVWGVLPSVAAELMGWQEHDDWAEPQILLRFPDEALSWPPQPHVDSVPPWSEGRRYRGIVGVALTSGGTDDGVPYVWPCSHRGEAAPPAPVPLAAGDALFMHPRLGHSGTLNLGPTVRAAVYFRLLTAAPPRDDHVG